MTTKAYKALIVEENGREYVRSVKNRTTDQLPDGQLLIRVAYSSLNYKDALSAIGNKGVTRKYRYRNRLRSGNEYGWRFWAVYSRPGNLGS